MGGFRVFAHAAQHQASACTAEKQANRQREKNCQINHGVLLKKRRPHKRQVPQQRQAVHAAPFQGFADVAHTHKGRKAAAKQADRQARGVLVGVEPDHECAKQACSDCACRCCRCKSDSSATTVKSGGKTDHGGNQHHALSAQIYHANFFIDQQSQPGQRQRRAG